MVGLAASAPSAHHRPMHIPQAIHRFGALLGSATLVVALVTLGSTGTSAAATVVLRPVVSGLVAPDFVTSPRDGSGRLFVVEQPGRIRVVKNGVLLPTPFLDISDMVGYGGERGLLGLAFHPSYKTNGLFYIDWTLKSGDVAVNQYKVSPTNPDVAIRTSSRRLLTIHHPNTNHNGGMIAFDNHGYLFVGVGDGGGSGDPSNNAQNVNVLLGKILRINVNGTTGAIQYRIPGDNPYVGRTGRDEVWSFGLRNPWRFSFDRATNDLWIGDVGQKKYEEIDRATSASSGYGRGINFGWRAMEGRHCYSPPTGCNRSGKRLPVVEYSHSEGCAVTGGYVYRGSAVPSLYARYVFADYCSGRIWTVAKGGVSPIAKSLLMDTSMSISSFGEDERGELYVVDSAGGAIYRFASS
jgi:glucose/arabinose dehydrogenase